MRYFQIKEAIDTGQLDPNLDAELKNTAKELDPKSTEDKRSFIDSVKMLGQKIYMSKLMVLSRKLKMVDLVLIDLVL